MASKTIINTLIRHGSLSHSHSRLINNQFSRVILSSYLRSYSSALSSALSSPSVSQIPRIQSKTCSCCRSRSFSTNPCRLHSLPLPSTSTSTAQSPSPNPSSTTQKLNLKPASTPDSRLLIGFTCKVCSTRSHKFMSERAYKTGVVIIKCSGCENHHLIADHLGWYDTVNKMGTIEEFMKEEFENKGTGVKKVMGSVEGLLELVESEEERMGIEKAWKDEQEYLEKKKKKKVVVE